MPRVRFDLSISVGNILTILGGLAFAFVWLTSIGSALAYLETRVRKNELASQGITLLREDVIRIQENQKNHDKMLSRIIDNQERR